jgi:hypothetical protein
MQQGTLWQHLLVACEQLHVCNVFTRVRVSANTPKMSELSHWQQSVETMGLRMLAAG